jgi:hypothetical protein
MSGNGQTFRTTTNSPLYDGCTDDKVRCSALIRADKLSSGISGVAGKLLSPDLHHELIVPVSNEFLKIGNPDFSLSGVRTRGIDLNQKLTVEIHCVCELPGHPF